MKIFIPIFIFLFSIITSLSTYAQFILPASYVSTGEIHSSWTPKWGRIIGYWNLNSTSDGSSTVEFNSAVSSTKKNQPSLIGFKNISGSSFGFDGTANNFKFKKSLKFIKPTGPEVNYLATAGTGTYDDMAKFSISVWVQVESSNVSSTTTILSKGEAFKIKSCSSNSAYICASIRTTLAINPFYYDIELTSTSTYANGNWQNIILTYNKDSEANLYFNGVLVNTQNSSLFKTQSNTSVFTLGANAAPDSNSSVQNNTAFIGRVDELAIWDIDLTADEVTKIYKRQARYSK